MTFDEQITGKVSEYGSYYSFDKLMEDINAYFVKEGGWRQLRKYDLGQSVARYKEYHVNLDWE